MESLPGWFVRLLEAGGLSNGLSTDTLAKKISGMLLRLTIEIRCWFQELDTFFLHMRHFVKLTIGWKIRRGGPPQHTDAPAGKISPSSVNGFAWIKKNPSKKSCLSGRKSILKKKIFQKKWRKKSIFFSKIENFDFSKNRKFWFFVFFKKVIFFSKFYF